MSINIDIWSQSILSSSRLWRILFVESMCIYSGRHPCRVNEYQARWKDIIEELLEKEDEFGLFALRDSAA